ncbi:class I SAM-dependent DNA methyltransferase [Phaeodactylibacter sp.]|uniref:class I SAM-dependent DNA methyltransferase n=1 Tax=Phaeodactylibacter sp. TaxID=1940289 RepID=UPI00341CD98D
MAKNKTDDKLESLEQQLWKAADKLRKNIDAAEYKHVVLGLIFLKYISDAFEELYDKLKKGEGIYEGADPEDKDEYKAENVFFVPMSARWNFIRSKGKQPDIGKVIDDAMVAIEKDNPSLKGVLPKIYARQNLDPTSLGGLIDLISNIALGDAKSRSADVLGHVFEYFLGQFALAEGKKGGQFYTPRSVVELLVEMLEPYKGRVFDPCCGSGGMFVQSEKFVTEHQGKINDISIYGQESNLTTWRLCKMNLAIRGIDSSQVKWNNEGSFLNDAHKDLKADYIIANPPFNISDWSGDLLRKDGRWQYGIPPTGNANFAWVQHFLYHLSPSGLAGFVLAKGALTSNTGGEDKIRKTLIDEGLIDCIVNLPTKLFLNTQIPASLWFLSRNRSNGKYRDRKDEVLFIDARNLGYLINRRTREFSEADIGKVAETYHNWKRLDGDYKDIPGFCSSASIEKIKEFEYVLTPGRYIGIPDDDDEFDFNERFLSLKKEFEEQIQEEEKLNEIIIANLKKIKVNE